MMVLGRYIIVGYLDPYGYVIVHYVLFGKPKVFSMPAEFSTRPASSAT